MTIRKRLFISNIRMLVIPAVLAVATLPPGAVGRRRRDHRLCASLRRGIPLWDIVFSKETLYERVWGIDAMGDNATVAVRINRLREKIEQDPAHPRHIQTVWGAGYRFRP